MEEVQTQPNPNSDINQHDDMSQRSMSDDSRKNSVWVMIVILVLIFLVGSIFIIILFNRPHNTTEEASTPNVDKIINRGTLIVGTDATFPPMESFNDAGDIIGYDIDLAQKIADDLGVELEIKNVEWDLLFDALIDGKVDMVISGVTITDDRKELYAFSKQYINAGQVILTRNDNTTITSIADLTDAKIAVQEETTNAKEALKYTDAENVLQYSDFKEATSALVNREADAIFSDLTGARGIIDENPTLKIASEPFTNDYYGIVMRIGENDLVDKVNSIIGELKQTGYLLYLHQKWLE